MSLPAWIKINNFNRTAYKNTLNIINKEKLNTVCVSGDCPNRYECFSEKTATFMILGDVCTRHCAYCNIKKGKPNQIDLKEPERVSKTIFKLGIKFAVITSVTRDDLEDGGSTHFVSTIEAIRRENKDCKIEVLIPDFSNNKKSIEKIIEARPDIINHNIETVENSFFKLRPKASYQGSLKLLSSVKKSKSKIKTKSGLMLGFGETKKDLLKTFNDLNKAGCDILTIGQYLKPRDGEVEVKKYYTNKEFSELEEIAKNIGIKNVFSGPLVRSSYKAAGFL